MQIDGVMCLLLLQKIDLMEKNMLNYIVVNTCILNKKCYILLQKVEQYAFVTRLAQVTDHIPVTMTISTL